jgi:hypothetical protein
MERPVALEGNLVPLENEPVALHLEYLGDREPVSTRMVHDRGLASRVSAVLEPTEHSTVSQIENLRSAARRLIFRTAVAHREAGEVRAAPPRAWSSRMLSAVDHPTSAADGRETLAGVSNATASADSARSDASAPNPNRRTRPAIATPPAAPPRLAGRVRSKSPTKHGTAVATSRGWIAASRAAARRRAPPPRRRRPRLRR